MPKFYFTYSLEGQPYVGGWSVIEAPNFDFAVGLFQMIHGKGDGGLIRCGGIYTEAEFKKTKMATNGNFGKFCMERISLAWDITDPTRCDT